MSLFATEIGVVPAVTLAPGLTVDGTASRRAALYGWADRDALKV